jgi:hypothetical protein
MSRFEQVKQILDDAVGGQDIAAHRRFWLGVTRDQFVAKSIYGEPLLVVGDGNASNLVKALRGELPFGADTGTPEAFYRRMPAGMEPVAPDRIDFVRQWIDDGCPDDPVEAEPPPSPPVSTPDSPPDSPPACKH